MVVKKIKFREYKDKSSIRKRQSRYLRGGETDVIANRLGWWERYDLDDNQNDDIYIQSLPKVYEYRPDLLAFDIYRRNDFDWIILQYNNIVDVYEEFIVGTSLIIPSPSRVNIDIMSNGYGKDNL